MQAVSAANAKFEHESYCRQDKSGKKPIEAAITTHYSTLKCIKTRHACVVQETDKGLRSPTMSASNESKKTQMSLHSFIFIHIIDLIQPLYFSHGTFNVKGSDVLPVLFQK